jgi:hypothetical protein
MRLRGTVIVNGEVYERGTTPPDDVAERITNPAAWDAAPVEPAEHPVQGSAAQVEAWVGDDPERARRALAAEAEREGGPRSTLVARLERIE